MSPIRCTSLCVLVLIVLALCAAHATASPTLSSDDDKKWNELALKAKEEAEKERLVAEEKKREAALKANEEAEKMKKEAAEEKQKQALLAIEEKRKAKELADIAQAEAFKEGAKKLKEFLDSRGSNTPSTCKCARCFLNLSDGQMYDNLVNGNKIGKCVIDVVPESHDLCDLYVKSGVRGDDGDFGWPKYALQGGLHMGSGCVMAPDEPKNVGNDGCWYRLRSFGLPKNMEKSFCTPSGKFNAVAQVRHAIRNNACKLSC